MEALMEMAGYRFLQGWKLTGWIALVLFVTAAAILLTAPEPVDGTRRLIRITARTSLVLFLLAFLASSLNLLFRSVVTRWLERNRRYIGLSFAVSHFIHAAAIIRLAALDYTLFLSLTNVVTYVAGGLAYVFIVLMAATSFDRTAALIGPRAWHWLHTAGAWYIWISFANNFGKRTVADSLYVFPLLLIVVALLVRILAYWRKTASRQASV
jgi:methionine sulfoxide reductase heme-binding subunit